MMTILFAATAACTCITVALWRRSVRRWRMDCADFAEYVGAVSEHCGIIARSVSAAEREHKAVCEELARWRRYFGCDKPEKFVKIPPVSRN